MKKYIKNQNSENRKENNTMKKIFTLTALLLALTSASATATEIPKYSVPDIATDESVEIVENIMGYILEDVQNGFEYGLARGMANTRIRQAVIANETNGYSYTVLSATATNALLQARDMYLRPEVYAENEATVRTLIADLISAVADGTMDYITAKEEAYIRLYTAADPSFDPEEQFSVDMCYRDIPAVDNAMFTIARMLLCEVR